MNSKFGRLIQYFRKRPLRSLIIFSVVFFTVVPAVPFTPHCNTRSFSGEIPILAPMSDQYREIFKAHLSIFGVYYWDIFGTVLLRALPFLDGDEAFDQYNGIHNAENKSAYYLAMNSGEVIAGKVWQTPQRIRTLMADYKNPLAVQRGCEFKFLLITNRPYSPGS